MGDDETTSRRRSFVLVGVPLIVAALIVAAVIILGRQAPSAPETTPQAATVSTPSATPTPKPTPTVAAVPPKPSQAALAAVPIAFYDAVIPTLPDPASLRPATTWQIATPDDALVALYASPSADENPIAALGSTVPTVGTKTAVAVYGRQGDMILVSTPSRRTVPGSPDPSAPSATFAWARAADFRLTAIDRVVKVDNASSNISIVTRAGATATTEPARLGTPSDPTPAATSTYLEADYVDTRITYTQGNPIALTGAHSSLLAGYGGNSALTALHFYPEPTGQSHGCVRISAAMTKALATLPVGTPILFS